jgi:hypothetical protein
VLVKIKSLSSAESQPTLGVLRASAQGRGAPSPVSSPRPPLLLHQAQPVEEKGHLPTSAHSPEQAPGLKTEVGPSLLFGLRHASHTLHTLTLLSSSLLFNTWPLRTIRPHHPPARTMNKWTAASLRTRAPAHRLVLASLRQQLHPFARSHQPPHLACCALSFRFQRARPELQGDGEVCGRDEESSQLRFTSFVMPWSLSSVCILLVLSSPAGAAENGNFVWRVSEPA